MTRRAILLDVLDVGLALAGLGALTAGIWAIYPPAAGIVGGVAAIGLAAWRSFRR